jgi:hypothetical protein
VHPVGDAPRGSPVYFRGWDIARSIAITPDGRGIYVLDGWGAVHVRGTAVFRGSPYWKGWDIAKTLALTPDGSGYAVLDGFGGIHNAGSAPRARTARYVRADVWRGLTSVSGGYIEVRVDGYSARV